jgi:hypothetical protein
LRSSSKTARPSVQLRRIGDLTRGGPFGVNRRRVRRFQKDNKIGAADNTRMGAARVGTLETEQFRDAEDRTRAREDWCPAGATTAPTRGESLACFRTSRTSDHLTYFSKKVRKSKCMRDTLVRRLLYGRPCGGVTGDVMESDSQKSSHDRQSVLSLCDRRRTVELAGQRRHC